MMAEEKKGFRELAGQTMVAYVRMGSTVVIAVVVRLCLDCIGIILTDQEPAEINFWFAHCPEDGLCVLLGINLFFASLVGCSVFAWSCQEWITDPARNPYARRYSFAIIVEASTWIPISVVVGKTNALVEWGMNIAEGDLLQALISSTIAAILTISCALLTHLAMTHCRGVQKSARVKEAGCAGFAKFFLLATLYCLGWAVAWSNWELVLSFMDALEPGRSMHNAVLATAVISTFVILSTCFYLRYGPEPIIPDPQLQQLCYNHGLGSSIRRSLVSYVVYSCVIIDLMCFCDPTYGILIVVARGVYAPSSSAYDPKGLLVLCALAGTVTLLAALCSAAITWIMDVDEFSSMKLSRSVHDACQRMVSRRRTRFEALLRQDQVLEDGFAEARELHLTPGLARAGDLDGEGQIGGGDESAGPVAPKCSYSRLETSRAALEEPLDVESERQLQLDPGSISKALCASVLIYDVLGFVVGFQWGMLAVRGYAVIFGHIASIHDALYVATCLLYAAAATALMSRFVFVCCPSAEELRCRESCGATCEAPSRGSAAAG